MSAKKKTIEDLIGDLHAKRAELEQGGGPDRQAKQREEGKQTARERVDALVDAGSFEEMGLFAQHRQTLFGMAGKEVPADGVVTGAAVDRRPASPPGQSGLHRPGRLGG